MLQNFPASMFSLNIQNMISGQCQFDLPNEINIFNFCYCLTQPITQLTPLMDPIFPILPQQTINDILNLPIDAECSLFRRKKIEQALNSIEDNKYQQIPIRLQLRKNYVLQLNPHVKQILSGFQSDISVTFKVIRANAVDIQEVGQTLGIQFRSDKFPKKNIFLYVQEQNKMAQTENLEMFADKLGKKYIIQDGFHEIYRAIKKIGKGVTASVYKALRLTDRKQVAVKSFKKDVYYTIDHGRGKAAFEKEFKAMTEVDSRYICKLISVYESDNSIYIAMELLTKSLYCYLKINGLPNLNSCKEIMVKLLIGISQLHQKGIMHRDLKLENIMILETESLNEPIIIDLGLAELSSNSQFLYTKCGTPGYVAPQILNLKTNEIPSPPYSHLCDLFSLGVIFYILLAGKTLFEGADERQVVRKNRECQIDYEFKNDPKFTQQMRDLLKKMLEKDPTKRSNAEELLNHQFFKQVQIIKEYQTRNTNTLMEFVEEKQKEELCKM